MLPTFVTLLSGYLIVAIMAVSYTLQNNLTGPTFFDAFDFWDIYDPTFGFVEYVSRDEAQSLGLLNVTNDVAYFGADSTQTYDPYGSKGRKSVRMTTKQSWTQGLFLIDLAHMPNSVCGIWPALWMLGRGPLLWPTNGEIDIVEFTNEADSNLFAMHTGPNCTIAGTGQSGTLLTNDCGEDLGYESCNIAPTIPNTIGNDFNAVGGGIYALDDGIPSGVIGANPDPDTFGLPLANFQGTCDIDEHFVDMSLIFNIDFCGTWAGPTFNTNTSCPVLDPINQWTSCNMFVAGNPAAFKEAYFAVNSIAVYQVAAGVQPVSSSVASISPAESTSSVSASGAEGRPTTTTSSLSTSSTVTPPVSSISTSASNITSSSLPAMETSSAASTEVIVMTSIITVYVPAAPHSSAV